jgi:O-antigen ligase
LILSRRFLFTRTPADLPILLFTLVAGLSVITAVDPRYSLEEFIGEWVIGVFLFYMVVNNVRPEQIKYILGALLLGNILMVGYGIFDFFRDGGQIFNRGIRATSLHSGLGTFSTYLVTIIPYVLTAIFFLKERSHRFIILILLSLNLFALLLTYSFGSWIAILVLGLLAGWFFAPRKVFIPFLLFIGLIIFLGAPQKVLYYYNRFTASNAHPDFYNTRWILVKFSMEKIKETPLQMNGFGRRTFAKKFQDFVEKYKGTPMWHAHNTFLNVAIQTGLQGLFLFCFLLYRMLRYCLERGKSGGFPLTRYYSLGTFLMIITFFVRNLSDDFFIDDSALLFWFLCGMIFALESGIENRKPTEKVA